jgi:hypothetical protein
MFTNRRSGHVPTSSAGKQSVQHTGHVTGSTSSSTSG